MGGKGAAVGVLMVRAALLGRTMVCGCGSCDSAWVGKSGEYCRLGNSQQIKL